MNIYGIGPALCYSAGIIFPIVCSLIVALRFYTRKTRRVHIGWDDWLVLPALVALIGICTAVVVGTALHGVGYPSLTSNSVNKPQTITRQVIWSTYLMGTLLLTCLKVSFILFYRRLFWQGSSKWYRCTLYGTGIILVVWGISYFFAFLFLCPGHPQYYWGTLADVKSKCIKTYAVYQSYATSDFILDVVVFILPLVPVYNLQMSIKKRIAVFCVFFLGAATIMASILRMITVWEVTAAQYKPGTDIPLILTRATYWAVLECGIALISCCLPTCSALLRTKREGRIIPQREEWTPRESGSSVATLIRPFAAYQKQTYHHSITSNTSTSEEAVAHGQVRPNEILVTRTFAAQPTPSPQREDEEKW